VSRAVWLGSATSGTNRKSSALSALYSPQNMPFAYYQRLNTHQKRIYRASDSVERIPLPKTEELRRLHDLVDALEEALTRAERTTTERAAQALTDSLTEVLKVPPLRIKVLRRRPSWETGELHGLYEPGADGVPLVSLWMRTAQRARVVKFKTFLRTLLHELCHHLDYERLQLEESFHTEGFYKRESSLVRELMASRAEPGPGREDRKPSLGTRTPSSSPRPRRPQQGEA